MHRLFLQFAQMRVPRPSLIIENTAKLPTERLGERSQVGVVISWTSMEKNDDRPVSCLIPGEVKISSGEDMFFPHGGFVPF